MVAYGGGISQEVVAHGGLTKSNTQQFLMLSRNVTKLKMALFDSMYVGLSPIVPFHFLGRPI